MNTPVAIDVHFSGVTSKTLKSFEKELTNDKVKLGSISLKTDIAVAIAPKAELASIARLKHVTSVTQDYQSGDDTDCRPDGPEPDDQSDPERGQTCRPDGPEPDDQPDPERGQTCRPDGRTRRPTRS